MSNCLLCYQPCDEGSAETHERCARKFYRGAAEPRLPVQLGDLPELAKSHVRDRVAISGVQKKLSLRLDKTSAARRRLIIVGFDGDIILKAPSDEYPELPELEDATMHMAEACGITVVPHGLCRFLSGEFAYLARRVDRMPMGEKIPMEDCCQIAGKMTEQKYHGSVEQVGKLIHRYSVAPGLDRVNFFEVLLFCFLTGNADMHLKNFSLLRVPEGHRLAPAYDLLPTALLLSEDDEDSALTVDGRKKNLTRRAFLRAASTMGLPDSAARNAIGYMLDRMPAAMALLRRSFVSPGTIDRYEQLIAERMGRLR